MKKLVALLVVVFMFTGCGTEVKETKSTNVVTEEVLTEETLKEEILTEETLTETIIGETKLIDGEVFTQINGEWYNEKGGKVSKEYIEDKEFNTRITVYFGQEP